MNAIRSFSLLSAFVAVAAFGAPAQPEPIMFDDEKYLPAGFEDVPERHAEHFIRAGETRDKFSRRLTIADQPKATSVKKIGLGVVEIARIRSPGLEPETFAAEGAEDSDLTVTWFQLTDDNAAVEFHAARFVAQKDKKGRTKGVREYHFVTREYTNGAGPDETLTRFKPVVVGFADAWIQQLQHLDRAPRSE